MIFEIQDCLHVTNNYIINFVEGLHFTTCYKQLHYYDKKAKIEIQNTF